MSEEGHVFDHEPGMVDYHHDRHPSEFEHHQEYYAEARYPVFLETTEDNYVHESPVH